MRLVALSVMAAVISVPAGAAASAAAPHRPANAAPAAVLALARAGLGRTFTARYHLSGQLAPFPGPSWTVTVAHRGAAPAHQNGLTSDGQWSFVLHAGGGLFVQWIENGNHHVTCWQRAGSAPRCGRGAIVRSNGIVEATIPYIPATVATALATLIDRRRGAATTSVRASRFGKLRCVDEQGSTICLTASGLPAWVRSSPAGPVGPFGNATIVLVSTSSRASATSFVPAGAPKGNDTPPV